MIKKINVFILEDNPNRMREFRKRFIEEAPSYIIVKIAHTSKVKEAIQLLRENTFNIVSLDHDLAEEREGMIRIKEETGYDVAQWLSYHPEEAQKHGLYITHSLNKPGRDRIVAALKLIGIRCHDIPYLWTEKIFWKYITFKYVQL